MARRVPVTKGRDNLGRDTLSYELRKGWRVTFAVSRAQTGLSSNVLSWNRRVIVRPEELPPH